MASRVKFEVVDVDRGLKKLIKRVFKRKSPHVVVGVYGPAASAAHKNGKGATVGEVAAAHEFGVPAKKIPKRSFLRDTASINERKINRNLNLITKRVVEGVESERLALSKLGVWFEGVVKKRIADGIPPKLKPATIKRKKSSKPLIDTGQLRNSVNSEVRDK